MRKVIQISTYEIEKSPWLIALCNDGSIWEMPLNAEEDSERYWLPVSNSIPQMELEDE